MKTAELTAGITARIIGLPLASGQNENRQKAEMTAARTIKWKEAIHEKLSLTLTFV